MQEANITYLNSALAVHAALASARSTVSCIWKKYANRTKLSEACRASARHRTSAHAALYLLSSYLANRWLGWAFASRTAAFDARQDIRSFPAGMADDGKAFEAKIVVLGSQGS